jgi:hypothetical protein
MARSFEEATIHGWENRNNTSYVRYGVSTVVTMKNVVF